MRTKALEQEEHQEEVAEMPLQFLLTGVLFLTVAGIASAYSAKVQTDIKDSFACNAGYVYNSSTNGCNLASNASVVQSLTAPANVTDQSLAGTANITSNFDIVGLIIAAVVVLGLIVGLFTLVR